MLNYNPDVLTCLANLSNDEIFTPPKIANQMLDLLPKKIWSNKNITFLDPVCKSGVFLREITKRLMDGLEKEIPHKQKRVNHILKNQVFGMAITELTSLLARRSVYCSKIANGKYSICNMFDNEHGNIIFENIQHSWKHGRCQFCGASEANYKRTDELESHAYQFIHTEKPEEIFNMKFDVVVGNPPYQLDTGGSGRQATPVYNKFIEQAKKLNPQYLIMIIPSRWFAGGMGLDKFRKEMLNDAQIRKIVDFENSNKVFSGVDIAGGICYFLWEQGSKGECEIINILDTTAIASKRPLNELPTFIRRSNEIPIIRKIINQEKNNSKKLTDLISSQKPFSLPTNYPPKKSGIPCWFTQRIGLQYASKDDIKDEHNLLNKWKLLLPKAPIAGQTDFSQPVGFYYDGNTRIAKPGECCTESWIVAFASNNKQNILYFKSYLFTKIVRFLLLQLVISQDVLREKFKLIPDVGKYNEYYTDDILRERWNINKQEWDIIDARIKDIALMNNRKSVQTK